MSPGEVRMVERERPRSYHGRPIVKAPVWTREVPWYLFAGGLAGASSMLAYGASRNGERELARRAWLVAFAGVSVSPALLISDLGRPARFLNMLRVFKVTSPMSVGSWVLMLNGAVLTPIAADAVWGRPRGLATIAEGPAALLGLALASYTGVLLSSTANPAWSGARRDLPALFAASGAASAGAAAAALTAPADGAAARRLAVLGSVAELALAERMKRGLGITGEVYEQGRPRRFALAARALGTAGAGLMAVGGGRRAPTLAGAGLILAGAVCQRWSVFSAGFDAAADPRYVTESQRTGR